MTDCTGGRAASRRGQAPQTKGQKGMPREAL
jgi:hypothetical protein